MGCCSPNDKTLVDFPFHKIEELNNLKSEISEIISDKGHKERKNINRLFELFDKTSSKINEFEKEVQLLKNKQIRNSNISDDMVRGLTNDIKQLKEYNHTLNDLIKESDENEIENNNYTNNSNIFGIKTENENEIRNDEYNNENPNFQNGNEMNDEQINLSNKDLTRRKDNNILRTKNNDIKYKRNNLEKNFQYKDDFQNESENNFQNDFNENIITNTNGNEILNTQNELENIYNIDNNTGNNTGNNSDDNTDKEEKVYFKKSIRRNKKGAVLNRKSNTKKNLQQGDYSESQEIQNINKFNENIQNDNENEYLKENLNNLFNEDDNLINLIFIFENGNKIDIQTGKNEKLVEVVEKVVENVEENNNLDNILIFDGEEDITDKVKTGEIISSFGLNDMHIIQLKFKD
jgi:hypothetical protein